MDIIDQDGRLFGVINIIDALVILLVLSLVAGSIVVLTPVGSQEPEPKKATRYATINLGTQPSYVAEKISTGDVVSPSGTRGSITITDVYITPGQHGDTAITVRAKVSGVLGETEAESGRKFEYNDKQIRVKTAVQLSTSEYDVEGTVTKIEDSGKRLQTAQSGITIRTVVSDDVAQNVQVGDEYRIANATVAMIETIQRFPTQSPDEQLLYIGIRLNTLVGTGGDRFFCQTRIALGNDVKFRSDGYALSGTVKTVDAVGIRTGTREIVINANVSTTVANKMATGDTYRISGHSVATISWLKTYHTEKQNVRRVVAGLRIKAVHRGNTSFFGEYPLELGANLPFRTGAYSINGTVLSHDSGTLPGSTEMRTVTVKVENVTPELVDDMAVGLTEGRGDATTARIVDKRVEPAVVILTSDSGNIYQRKHPRNKDVYLTVQIQVRETPATIFFHGVPLQTGKAIALNFRTTTVRGTVIDITNDTESDRQDRRLHRERPRPD